MNALSKLIVVLLVASAHVGCTPASSSAEESMPLSSATQTETTASSSVPATSSNGALSSSAPSSGPSTSVTSEPTSATSPTSSELGPVVPPNSSGAGGEQGAGGGANSTAGGAAGTVEPPIAKGGAGGETGSVTSGSDDPSDAGTMPGTAGSDEADACATASCAAPAVVTYPVLPDALQSPLYTVTANGTELFVEKLAKFSPEMQVHYAHCSLSELQSATFAVTVSESFNSYVVSPKSRNFVTSKSGNTLSFDSGPNYVIVQVDTKELLFIFIDDAEVDPPKLGDANVKSIADYGVDATGATLVTTKVQEAIDAASGATQNILYFPPGKYTVGELWLKSDMTLYLAGGAVLYGSGSPADFNTGSGGVNIEDCSHGMIRMYQISNTKVLGRGVIDGNGKAIRAQNDTKLNLFKIEQSSDILIDGIVVRDPSFWNTLIYRSDLVTIKNYKMVNCRPTTTTYNNTDGVNFDESTNGLLSNAFLYTGDDSMATKNEEPSGTVNTKNIVHERVVCYSNSVGCKVGTKTMGQTIEDVVFRDIDVVKAGRALNIDAYDTAVVQNTRFENIRIEAADSSMIAISLDEPPDWRDAANTSVVKDTYFTNVTSDVRQPINLHGSSANVNIVGVHFDGLTVQGNPVTSQTDADANWSINSFVSGVDFAQP